MNQALLTRLFKSIEGNKETPLMKIAFNIVNEERKKGHVHLADKLEHILIDNLGKQKEQELKPIRTNEFKLPVDRRYRLPLASHIPHEKLRYHMVLSTEVESKVQRIEKEFLAQDRLAHHGLKPRKRILFYGSSGCGKSMAAEKIAWDLGLPFYKVRFDSIISSYLGESASNLNKLFESIEDYPCVLLLDEFDIIGKQRDPKSNDVGEIHRIVNILLGLLEEYNGKGLLIATTNLEGSLDKALFRRFDDFIEFPKPTIPEIKKLLQNSFSSLHLHDDVDLTEFSQMMEGLSFAIVEKVAHDAAKKSIIHSHKSISSEDIKNALMENRFLNT
ncbi:ATP-binding protein [Litoribacter alkaliphilus]|uniref:ATP-binding protein n=1 Tax=Litoribacter ruber TaxID=702568 RepID=A0AAP2G5T6_9BACT|nr:ATP-binding protein [Litoribacter alkaliphilus]MBS9525875.1 ATP-binding protein [Litoribacter alkaliphilus]